MIFQKSRQILIFVPNFAQLSHKISKILVFQFFQRKKIGVEKSDFVRYCFAQAKRACAMRRATSDTAFKVVCSRPVDASCGKVAGKSRRQRRSGLLSMTEWASADLPVRLPARRRRRSFFMRQLCEFCETCLSEAAAMNIALQKYISGGLFPAVKIH